MGIVVRAGRHHAWGVTAHGALVMSSPLLESVKILPPLVIAQQNVGGGVVKPDATNTGPTGYGLAYSQLTPAATTTISGITKSTNLYTITAPGTYTGIDFDGLINIAADNVTLKGCRMICPKNAGNYAIAFTSLTVNGVKRPPLGFHGTYMEIDGNGTDATSFVGGVNSGWCLSTWIAPGWSWTADHMNIYHFTDDCKPQDNPVGTAISLTYSYFHDPIYTWDGSANGGKGGTSHNDGFQIAGGGADSVTIQYNNYSLYRLFDMGSGPKPMYASGASQFGSFSVPNAKVTNLVVDSNWLDGFVDALRMAFTNSQVASVAGSRFTRNRIGLKIQSGAKTGSGTALDGTRFLWGAAYQTGYDNVWDVSGTTDHGDVVTANQVIP